MPLSHLIKHIYNNAGEEVIRRGRKIQTLGTIDIIDHDVLLNNIVFRVKDDMYNTWYKVKVDNYTEPRNISLRCSCPYNLTQVCRHKAAALLQLQEMADRGMLSSKEVVHDQRHTRINMRNIDLKVIRIMAGAENYEHAEELLRTGNVSILSAANEVVKATVNDNDSNFQVVLSRNEERTFDTACNCVDADNALCSHKTSVFLQLLNSFGHAYFESIRDVDRDKAKLLAMYGYTLQDDLTGKFEFLMKDGKPFLKVLDSSIQRVNIAMGAPPPSNRINTTNAVVPVAIKVKKRAGIVIVSDDSSYSKIRIEAVAGEADEDAGIVGRVEVLDLSKYIDTAGMEEEDKELLFQLRKISSTELDKFLTRNSTYSGIWDSIVVDHANDLPEETKFLIQEYLQPKYARIFKECANRQISYWLPGGKSFITQNLETAAVHSSLLQLRFSATLQKNNGVLWQAFGWVNEVLMPLEENELDSFFLIKKGQDFYAWSEADQIGFAEKHAKPMAMDEASWLDFSANELPELERKFAIDFDASLVTEKHDLTPDISVELQEKNEFLTITPVYSYEGVKAEGAPSELIRKIENGRVAVYYRNVEKERDFFTKLQSLHGNYIRPDGRMTLVLKAGDVLRNNWFFKFLDAMKELDVPVVGFDSLRNFRFNRAKPSTQVRISSGLDWFDAKINVSFDNEKVRIADIKQALSEKKNVVQLQDGTLGILPEEWISKYALLLKVGEGGGENLRLSRYQFGVIDELYDQRDEIELQVVLEEKFEKLREFRRIRKIDPPEHLKPILRPYQETGFHWLCFLKETGCGGILADDMGLGKTLQALTMLEDFENKTGNLKALVVCPTSLLYNWENEIKKFTPQMEYFIHHGPQRTRNHVELSRHHIVITTYGTLRSDILVLKELTWDYVILDESQAIKNPNSKVAKAATLLQSNHRICMSGTPLQNNTFDIYAQMNFLNPGLLGSTEFFRNEFATPIDKFGEKEQKEHLRKLMYPFILRRTKEQVARDLPEKTETVLYCEMEAEQRRIYDAYKNDYRDKVLGVIDAQGMERSQLTILQGLMKLRQICDSPAILNEDVKLPNHSIKLDELLREITENISDHKALVFSQFLGMLALIRQRFIKEGIAFEYFDGSTSINERQRAIDNFQNNNDCRVFLISLKAGGVGLNLTAADYVYIVDPWWNPAVEQQAIDRTHRIGQTRNIFAYRMICRDTVEDKIIQLQEKKRLLAKELIADDSGFVKKLTRDDIAYLFS